MTPPTPHPISDAAIEQDWPRFLKWIDTGEPNHPVIEREWQAFVVQVRDRLVAGAATYGDESFTRPPADLLLEIQHELLDVFGWAFITWHAMREKAGTTLASPILDVCRQAFVSWVRLRALGTKFS